MTARPYVLLSCAMSLDGRIDDCSPQRLVLSSQADLDRVDEVRAGCDAILVGARTLRRDNPGLAVRSELRRAERTAAGRPATPLRAVLTSGGRLDPDARFFLDGAEKVVYRFAGAAPRPAPESGPGAGAGAGTGTGTPAPAVPPDLSVVATVVDLEAPPLEHLLDDLSRRGTRRLLVEGGTTVHTAFLTAGLVDELHLVIAPFFVGEAAAPTFVGPGSFPFDTAHRLRLVDVRQLDGVVLLRYLTPSVT
ncbi:MULTISPECIES: RibD family protein [unclassified Parafrankia]|uniref:RibD family protein n=1 Tax=unclassified Parafrankia TaxID=2994368 RepID=UPI000DA460AF|nr:MULTISPECIES: RibD family protein [unclassified Parafrankia]TCJ40457.1 RibD family protein [Parafrankia sp. BMG5.11]CAI7977598.1 5-amino-6-(5-phosphoribosylamino)uracil reductase [Frankia sp. Hr75.2]SQD99894.1 Bifunctional deaminase-reductase domain protein [Parafrankia sp. Ea1.12]